jgi:hypothetical protein
LRASPSAPLPSQPRRLFAVAHTVPGGVEASGTDTTVLKVEGNFNVTGPLETFANAGGVHVARAILAEFAENVARLMAEQTIVDICRTVDFEDALRREASKPVRWLPSVCR